MVSYRLTFETRRIIGNDLKIGGHGSAISLVILDFKSELTPLLTPIYSSITYPNFRAYLRVR